MKSKLKYITFLKPLEVYPSFTPIINTWSIISKRLKCHNELKEAFLLRSENEDAKYGFISASVWDSKKSFKKAVDNDTLLKLHHSGNGKSFSSCTHNLYKSVYESPFIKINKVNLKALLYFFKPGESIEKKIFSNAERIESELKNLNINYNLNILKAVYSRNNIGFVFSLTYNNKESIKFFMAGLANKYFNNKTGFQNSAYKIESYIKNN